jgi:hypothetical protein
MMVDMMVRANDAQVMTAPARFISSSAPAEVTGSTPVQQEESTLTTNASLHASSTVALTQ